MKKPCFLLKFSFKAFVMSKIFRKFVIAIELLKALRLECLNHELRIINSKISIVNSKIWMHR